MNYKTQLSALRKSLNDDHIFIGTFFTLIAIGLIAIFSASSLLSVQQYGNSSHYVQRQGLFVLAGFFSFYIFSRLPYHYYQKHALPILAVALFFVLLVLIPGVGIKRGGATRWLPLIFFNVQPSEFLKLALVIYLANSISKIPLNRLQDFKHGFMPFAILVISCMTIVLLQRDFGSAMTIGLCSIILLFVAGTHLKYLIYSLLSLICVSIPLVLFSPYRMNRVLAFLDPWADFKNKGYQIIQSYVAFQAGGITGMGLGAGKQKLFYLPAGHTDFIFSVLAEETGLIGCSFVLLGFLVLFWRGMALAQKSCDAFGYLLATGILVLFTGNVIINLCVVMGLLPTKGLTLPLFSYGGSSLLMYMTAFGILVNIFSRAKKNAPNLSI